MAKTNVIPVQKIQQAAGNNSELREILQALSNTGNLQLTATNTAIKNTPPQVRADVSFLAKSTAYVVQITNPGAVSPVSAIQATEARQNATASSNIANVVSIYHQIRVATSPRFSISDNVQTFGGDTGSTQTYWEISSLGSGLWYFQVRSSYDGVNWNLWKNANGGQTITGRIEGVTVEDVTNGAAALFSLSGNQLFAAMASFAADGQSIGVPSELYTSAMLAIAGPNGFQPQPSNLAHGIIANEVDIPTPSPLPGGSGPPDYPAYVREQYQDGQSHVWSGSANVFAFLYDPLADNYNLQATSDGLWVDFQLPGGAHFTIGAGVTADGAAIGLPSDFPWVVVSRLLSIVSPNVGFNATRQARGITQSVITGGVMHCQFEDTTAHAWSATGNWLAFSWSAGYPVVGVSGGQWLPFVTPSGTKVAFGAGSGPNGSALALPVAAGAFTSDKMLGIATPASAAATSHPMAGVYKCAINPGTPPTLETTYTDTQGNYWNGSVNWMAFAWE
jgi:hypothetical protein